MNQYLINEHRFFICIITANPSPLIKIVNTLLIITINNDTSRKFYFINCRNRRSSVAYLPGWGRSSGLTRGGKGSRDYSYWARISKGARSRPSLPGLIFHLIFTLYYIICVSDNSAVGKLGGGLEGANYLQNTILTRQKYNFVLHWNLHF